MTQPDLPDKPTPLPIPLPAWLPRPSQWRPLLQILKRVGLMVGAGLLIWQTGRAIAQISATQVALPGGWALLGAVVLAMLSHLTQMAGWREVMAGLGTRLSWRQVIEGYMLAMLPRYIPGTVWGYLSRGQWLYDRAGVSFRRSTFSSIIEMGLFILSGLVFVAAAHFQSVLAGLAVMAGACFGYALLGELVKRLAWADRLPVVAQSSFVRAFVLCGLIWPLYGLIITCLVGVPTGPWRALIDFGAAYFFAWLSGLLVIFIPSGLGVREYALQAALQNYNLGSTIIIVTPILVRLAAIASEIAWLCVGLALKRRR